jgi:hypothetical protein
VNSAESQLPKGLVARAQCPPGTSYQTSNDAYKATQTRQGGLALTVVGAILLASGLSWHLLESSAAPRVAVSLDRGMTITVDSRF